MNAPRDPHNWVESWAWPMIERGDIPSSAGLVLLRLAAHGNASGMAKPSARRLAKFVGRSERAVRSALETLRELGYIDGKPAPARVTEWRLVTEESERQSLRELRTHPPQFVSTPAASTADPSSAVADPSTADQLRTNCGATADPSSYEGEGEGEELLPSLPAATRDVGEEEQAAFKEFARGLPHLRRVA